MQCGVPGATLRTQFVHIHCLIRAAVNAADMSCVKTIMAAPIGDRFRVGTAQLDFHI